MMLWLAAEGHAEGLQKKSEGVHEDVRQKLFITSLVVCRMRHGLSLLSRWQQWQARDEREYRIRLFSDVQTSDCDVSCLSCCVSCTSEMRVCFSCSVSEAGDLMHVATRPGDMLETLMRSKSSYEYKQENKSKMRQGSSQCTYHSTLHDHKNMSIFFSPTTYCLSFIYIYIYHMLPVSQEGLLAGCLSGHWSNSLRNENYRKNTASFIVATKDQSCQKQKHKLTLRWSWGFGGECNRNISWQDLGKTIILSNSS